MSDRSRRLTLLAGLSLVVAGLAGCVTLPSDFKEPGVALVSITPRLLNSMAPEFDILLRVTNPNREALKIRGLSYEVRLGDRKVVDGVANDLPRIEAYGEADVNLSARADLFGALDVLTRLMNNPNDPVDYAFDAEIDIGALYPMVKVSRSGSLAP
jgi:LEA14-like dessication related protein